MTPVDVALVLEGTYPYRLGGVSTWTHALIGGLPGVRFGVVHLTARDAPEPAAFEVPPNLAWVRPVRLPARLEAVDGGALAAGLPPARLVHALSTGFASDIAIALARRDDAPLVVTEHGLAWREVAEGAPELETGLRLVGRDVSDGNPCASRAHWVERFRDAARRAYAHADAVTTVCHHNRAAQLALGAPPERSRVIPNGVAPPATRAPLSEAEIAALHPAARRDATVRIGYVGRVAPLKDVGLFVQAAARVAAELPGARFVAIGPDEDPAYAARMRDAVRRAGLDDRFDWTGPQPVALWLRHLDVVALTSRSEAQPLVALEAMAAGVAVVATDVGGCRALLDGTEPPADGLGPAGLVVPAGDAAATADAWIALARDGALRARFGAAGLARVQARFGVAQTVRSYGELYRRVGTLREVVT